MTLVLPHDKSAASFDYDAFARGLEDFASVSKSATSDSYTDHRIADASAEDDVSTEDES